MPILDAKKFRSAALAAGAVCAVLLASLPASADHGRRYRGHRGPKVSVIVGLPPFVIAAGRPAYGYYDPYDRPYRGGRRYERGYEDGYEDGYDDRAREEWRRRERARHHRHHDCDHDDWY
jgi:hypothetical protein